MNSLIERSLRERNYIQSITSDYDHYYELLESIDESEWNYNFFHNKEHTRTVLNAMIFDKITNSRDIQPYLLYAAIFHDIGYTALQESQEEISYEIGKSYVSGLLSESDIMKFKDVIIVTYRYDKFLSWYDLNHFRQTTKEILEVENLMMKEFGMVDYELYRKTRKSILEDLHHTNDIHTRFGISVAMGHLDTFEPKIGWFCGTFDPFHVGHYNILKRAERMFDKVVIVAAINPNKSRNPEVLSKLKELKELKNYEIIGDVDHIPELILQKEYKPILIRGIRNNDDYIESSVWIKEINYFLSRNGNSHKQVDMCMIDADEKYRIVSSSYIRKMGVEIHQYTNLKQE